MLVMTTKRSSRRRLLTADLLYSSLLIVLVYVTMLNGFVYDAYWSEKIERAFGLLDQLQPKELGLAISDADYYDWGLSVCDASSRFLTSWSGLSFYAISILILLLHLLPLLFVRSRYLYLITFALDACYWGIYLYAFGWLSRYLVEEPPVQKDSSSCFGSMSSSSAGISAKSAYFE